MAIQDCNLAADRKLWPVIGCRDFDFTLAFEQIAFAIGISALFLLFAGFRVKNILKSDVKAASTSIHRLKIVFAITDIGLQIAGLVLWIHVPLIRYSIISACMAVVAALGVLVLVTVEHTKTVRPSTIISVYLLAAILAECVELRTLLLRGYAPLISKLVAASVVNKTVILLLESKSKMRILKIGDEQSPEEISGIFNQAFLLWLNPLLWKGYNGILKQEDMFPLDEGLRSSKLSDRMIDYWEKNRSKKTNPLIRATANMFWRQFLDSIPPRILVIATAYAQTFVMSAAIRYLDTPSSERQFHTVYPLLVVTFLCHFGGVLAYILYQAKINRIESTFRGAMVGLIYHYSLSTSSAENDLAAVTLMSTDVATIANNFFRAFEMWAYTAEVIVGVWLLWRQLGPVAIGPVLIMAVCSYGQKKIGNAMSKRRAVWTAAIQKRVALTSNLLRSMKSVKLTGMVETSVELVQSERIRELELGKRYRWLVAWMNGVAFLPFTFSTLVVFATYAVQAKLTGTSPLTTAQAFSSLAIMMIFRGSASRLIMTLPILMSVAGTFERIEKYLQKNRFEDHRPLLHGPTSLLDDSKAAIELKDVVLDIHSDMKPSVIQYMAPKGSITIISGPVGCGKSTLLKAVLGEIQLKSGRISVSTPYIGYCAQTPWLQNKTLKKNIIGINELDEAWYRSIIRICNLEPDIAQMPNGHDTLLGSRGVTISGGQKHRIALARALYSRSSILLLDDIFQQSRSQDSGDSGQ